MKIDLYMENFVIFFFFVIILNHAKLTKLTTVLSWYILIAMSNQSFLE